MAMWIEVKARYDRMLENGTTKRVTEPYLVDALSCTEAEARVIEELTPFTNGDLSVTSASKTKIVEVFLQFSGDRFYKVKVNFITLDEKTAVEKKTASYIIVPADNLEDALHRFKEGMRGTMSDYEIEAVTETKYVDLYTMMRRDSDSKEEMLERAEKDPAIMRHVNRFRNACAAGGFESVTISSSDGKTVHTATLEMPLKDNKPKTNDNG
ncbi:MAG: DUF4494 domain-containing protein [Muribaculaceae bacterium]|nr:DUF4494 domain-containing protein [Muribaculaceae bacterium]